MPEKNNENDIEMELIYSKELEKRLEEDPSVSSTPAVKEKLNLLNPTCRFRQV